MDSDGLAPVRGILNALAIEVLIALVMLAACATRSHAQTGPQTALTLGSIADAASTVYALQTNSRAREANPLLAHGGTVGMLAGKSASTAWLVWVTGKLQAKHPRVAKIVGYGGGAALSALAARNVSLAQQRGRR